METPTMDATDIGKIPKVAMIIIPRRTDRTMGDFLFMLLAGSGGWSNRITSSDFLNLSMDSSVPKRRRVSLGCSLIPSI